MHLLADGLIGRHQSVGPQLVACVAGGGQVSGGDGQWRELRPGYAAQWDDGEEHETRSDDGMTLVCIEGRFDVWAMGVVTDEIVIADHDPQWVQWFEQLSALVWPAVEDIALRIDHVGSTSVPGLAAKPIIDMDIVVASDADIRPVIGRLRDIGYVWRGELGVEGRHAFKRYDDVGLPRHHLYLVVDGNKAHLDHVLLRDLLRADPDARERYAALKRANVEVAAGDMDIYVEAKAALVTELLARARVERGREPRDAT